MSDAGVDDHTRLHEAVAGRLEAAGQRYTEGRRQLVHVLASEDRPLTMYDILSRVRMPQSSAYRHLTALTSLDIVHRMPGNDDTGLFEITDEVSGRHHHHVVCRHCGRVCDVAASPRLEKMLGHAAEVAEAETGFSLVGHRIDLFGTCPDCQKP